MARDQIIQANQTAHHRDMSPNRPTGSNDPYRSNPVVDRETASNWHVSPVGKALNTVKDISGDAVQSSTSVFSSAIKKIRDVITGGNVNSNLRDLSLTAIAGIFGLKTISSLLGAPKYMSDPAYRKKSSPMILGAGKFISGTALAYGLLSRVMGGAGLSTGGMIVGITIFAGLQFFTSLYEDKNSIAGKILDTVGLRDKLVDAMKFLKFESAFTGE